MVELRGALAVGGWTVLHVDRAARALNGRVARAASAQAAGVVSANPMRAPMEVGAAGMPGIRYPAEDFRTPDRCYGIWTSSPQTSRFAPSRRGRIHRAWIGGGADATAR